MSEWLNAALPDAWMRGCDCGGPRVQNAGRHCSPTSCYTAPIDVAASPPPTRSKITRDLQSKLGHTRTRHRLETKIAQVNNAFLANVRYMLSPVCLSVCRL